MAPLNQPVGNERSLITLDDQLCKGIPGQAEYGVRSYFESVRQATLLLRDRAIEAWYPTHFLHAWPAARVRSSRK